VKYICFGYLDTKMWSKLSQSEQTAMMDDCIAYDEQLQKNGHWAGGEALQGPETATMLRTQNGKVVITDGPYAETKEMLGGLLFLEAKDLNQAIQLMSNHPGAKMGPWEIRPAADLTAIVAESKKRRS
jgi:hypothetical protein